MKKIIGKTKVSTRSLSIILPYSKSHISRIRNGYWEKPKHTNIDVKEYIKEIFFKFNA